MTFQPVCGVVWCDLRKGKREGAGKRLKERVTGKVAGQGIGGG
jgi:hypothetical protein